MTESNVTPRYDYLEGCYTIEHASGDSELLDFDTCLDSIERYAIELTGRGAGVRLPRFPRGSLAAYDTMQNLRDKLRRICEEQDDLGVADLTQDLIGLEGELVSVEDMHGTTRRFEVGRTEGWIPTHLEITTSGIMPAEREYKYITVLWST